MDGSIQQLVTEVAQVTGAELLTFLANGVWKGVLVALAGWAAARMLRRGPAGRRGRQGATGGHPGPRRRCGFGRDVERLRVDVDENGFGADVEDAIGRGDEAERGGNDLVPLPDTGRQQGLEQGRRVAIGAGAGVVCVAAGPPVAAVSMSAAMTSSDWISPRGDTQSSEGKTTGSLSCAPAQQV